MDVKVVVSRCSQVAWQFQTTICFPTVKQGLILESEAERALIWMSSMSESHWRYLFHKEGKSWDSTTWFRIWQFQTPPQKLYLQMHLLAERLVFWGWWSGFSDGLSQDLPKGTNVVSQIANFFFCLQIYSLESGIRINPIYLLILRWFLLCRKETATARRARIPFATQRILEDPWVQLIRWSRWSPPSLLLEEIYQR